MPSIEKINRPKSEWPKHPMTINAGYKTFDIVQDPKLKEFGAVEFVKSTMYINPHLKDEDYKGTFFINGKEYNEDEDSPGEAITGNVGIFLSVSSLLYYAWL